MDVLNSCQLENGNVVYFSVVEKESQKGFSMNKRMMLMLEDHFLCYLSRPILNSPLTNDYIQKNAKMVVPLKQINKFGYKREDMKIVIQFYLYDKNRRIDKTWNIKLNNINLLNQWQALFDDFANRSRNNTLEKLNNLRTNKNQVINENLVTDYYSDQMISKPKQSNGNEGIKIEECDEVIQTQTLIRPGFNQNITPKKPINTSNNVEKDNESYFSNLSFMTPSPLQANQLEVKIEYNQSKINIENSNVKNRSVYFSNQNGSVGYLPNNSSHLRYSFKNYYRPYLQTMLNNQNSIAKMIQLEQISKKIGAFGEYAHSSVINLIDTKLSKLKELARYKDIKLQINEESNWITCEDYNDIVIELGLIELKNVKNQNYVCDDSLTKTAKKNLKNLEYLYSVVSKDQELSSTFFIPMMCVVKYKGYMCFVKSKVAPLEDIEYQEQINYSLVQTSKVFDRLSTMARIGIEVFENEKYIKFIPKNHRKDKFIISYAKTFLPEFQNSVSIRKQSFSIIYPESEKAIYVYHGSKRENEHQTLKITNFLNERVNQLGDLMNKLEIYPICPSQMSQIMHCYGLNVKNLNQLYAKINQYYIQNIIKTETALRVFKTIFNKKLQQNLGRSIIANYAEETSKNLINILLGFGEATNQLWKVISLHSQIYFNLSIDLSQINKGYLLLGLNHYLNIQTFNNYSSIDKIFKSNNFIDGVKFHAKTEFPNILPTFMKILEEDYDISMNESLFNQLIRTFELGDHPFPSFIKFYPYLYSKMVYLLSYYIKPHDKKYQHLKIYGLNAANQYEKMMELSVFNLQKSMVEIKWEIKNQSKVQYIIMLTNKIKDNIQKYYGKNHPFVSDIYELQSLYFLQILEEEQAIGVNKESLSNMIQCCGNNSRHLKISNSYFQLAQCLKKCYKFEEAILNYKKAKNILQINSYQNLPEYAHILYKLGVMYLLQNKDNQSYQLFMHSVVIYEKSDIYNYWQHLVDLYEGIHRCQVKITTFNKVPIVLYDIKLAEHCVTQLEKVLSLELQFQLCNDWQFIRLFKIIVELYIGRIKKDHKKMFKEYILQICEDISRNPQNQNIPQSIIYFKTIIYDGKFCELIQSYMNDTYEILTRLKNDKRIGRLIPSRRNELIENYDQFMKHLTNLLGEPFLLNTII